MKLTSCLWTSQLRQTTVTSSHPSRHHGYYINYSDIDILIKGTLFCVKRDHSFTHNDGNISPLNTVLTQTFFNSGSRVTLLVDITLLRVVI